MENNNNLHSLKTGTFKLKGQFVRGSNYTFLGEVQLDGELIPVVYKPSRGEQPLWDFPQNTLAKRETAAFLFSQWLGLNLVPPTVYRKKGLPFGSGSVQLYIHHDVNYHYFSFSDEDRMRLDIVALMDLLMNNADRKGSHVLIDSKNNIWCIDHGLCFHNEDKLRTVIWDFAGKPIRGDLLEDIKRLVASREDIHMVLKPYLTRGEINSMLRRAVRLLENPVFPIPGADRRMFPFPPL